MIYFIYTCILLLIAYICMYLFIAVHLFIRVAVTENGQVYTFNSPQLLSAHHQQPQAQLTFSASLRSNQQHDGLVVVDVHCALNHGACAYETGDVGCFVLNDSSQPLTALQPASALNVQRVWILPAADCLSLDRCACWVVLLTKDSRSLYVCAAPSNKNRWMHHLGAVPVTGLQGIYQFLQLKFVS